MSRPTWLVLVGALVILAPDPGTSFWHVNVAEAITLVIVVVGAGATLYGRWRRYRDAIAFHPGSWGIEYDGGSLTLTAYVDRPLDTDVLISGVITVGDRLVSIQEFPERIFALPVGTIVRLRTTLPGEKPADGEACWAKVSIRFPSRWSGSRKTRAEYLRLKVH